MPKPKKIFHQYSFRLIDSEGEVLDAIIANSGLTTAEWIRRAIREAMSSSDDK